jgi:hypothetical protein
MTDIFAALLTIVVGVVAIGVWQLHRDLAGLMTQMRDVLVEMSRSSDAATRAAEGASRAAEAARDIALAIRDSLKPQPGPAE